MLVWLRQQVEWMWISDQGKEIRGYEDNKTIWYYAIVSMLSEPSYFADVLDTDRLSSIRHFPT